MPVALPNHALVHLDVAPLSTAVAPMPLERVFLLSGMAKGCVRGVTGQLPGHPSAALCPRAS
jgi:hypothetical protein